MRVAILGTGRMGSAMARRLSAQGVDLVLWNRTQDRAVALGIGQVAASARAAVDAVDAVISILTDADAVRAAYLGPDGAAAGAGGQVFVEMSTCGPAVLGEIAPALAASGSRLIDAPVLGSVPAVESGTLAIVAGGSADDLGRVQLLLAHLGEVTHVGPSGSGARLKLIANSMLGGVSALAAELQGAGVASGLPAETVFWALARVAPYLRARERGFLEGRHEPTMFALRDMVKDLDLGLGLYGANSAATPLVAEARRVFASRADRDGGKDLSAVTDAYRA